MSNQNLKSNESKTKVLVIGVGALGRHHARIISGLERAELIGVADPNETQGRSVAEQHSVRWAADYRELLAECDAVSIVAPTFLHHQIASDCLKAGKDLLVEKPLTASINEASELIELAEQQDCILQVGHIERFNPAYELLCESLTSVPRYIQTERVSPFPFRSLDIGAIHDLMIHDIELVLNLTGAMPVQVTATGSRVMGAHEDTVQARLTFPDGCIADLTASRICPEARRTMQVWSATEMISANLQTRTVQLQRPTQELLQGPAMEDRMRAGEEVTELKSRVFSEFFQMEELQGEAIDQLTAELSEFVDAVQTRQQPRVTGKQGLSAVEVADLILHALEENCINARQLTQTQKRQAA